MSWKNCTSCRKEIGFDTVYWECSVSTCNRKRIGLFFCSVACWDAHLPEARHREAWAIEKKSPNQDSWKQQEVEAALQAKAPTPSAPARRVIGSASSAEDSNLPKDVLVVVSKMKKYIKAKGDMKTSETAIPVLSQELRRICDRAIRIAGTNGRKTVMDKDVRDALKE